MLKNDRSFLRIDAKWTGFFALCSKMVRSFCTLLENDPVIFEQ